MESKLSPLSLVAVSRMTTFMVNGFGGTWPVLTLSWAVPPRLFNRVGGKQEVKKEDEHVEEDQRSGHERDRAAWNRIAYGKHL